MAGGPYRGGDAHRLISSYLFSLKILPLVPYAACVSFLQNKQYVGDTLERQGFL